MSLITTRIKAEDIGLPKWAKKALEERGLKENEVEVYRKGISPEDTKINKGERSTVDYITTKVVDRDGDIVVPKGAVLDHYRKNPVVLFAHNYSQLPIGKSLWIKADEKGLIAKTQYAKHQKAEEVYQYRKDGFPMAKSIGFIPLSVIHREDFADADLKSMDLTEDDIKGADRIYPEWLMLEYSDVPVPSNPEALQLAISKGIITTEEVQEAGTRKAIVLNIVEEPEEKEVILKPETTDNYHHIPVRDKGDFVDDSFRTITLSEDQGIKAVIGKLKSDPDGSTKTQKYMFDVNKWTMEEAQSWVSDHKDLEAEDRKEMLDKRYGEDIVVLELNDDVLPEEVVEEEIEEEPEEKEVEIDVKSTLVKILETLEEHGRMIQELKEKTEIEELPFELIESEVEEKAGRVLSKKTRGMIADALSAMEKATVALNDLVENADSKEGEEAIADEQLDEEIIDEKSDEVVLDITEEVPQLIEVDEDKLKKSIADAFNDILRSVKPSVGDMVKESLDRRNGKIF